MTTQVELFITPAIERKDAALAALENFDLPKAKSELEIAHGIDPSLADIKSLLQAVGFLLAHDLDMNSDELALTAAWQKLWQPDLPLPAPTFARVETMACQRILHFLPPDYSDFIDPETQTLHVGYCHLVLKQMEAAHQALLDFLTAGANEKYPRIWAYLGDAATLLNRSKETNTGYVYALFLDAQAVDFKHLKHPELRRITRELSKHYPENERRSLLPIHAWLEGLLTIPKGDSKLLHLLRQQRAESDDHQLHSPEQRYHQFATSLFVDQANLHNEIDVAARKKMQRLDGDLFQRYLKKVAAGNTNP